ncbi:MAG: hypothetical protein KAR79_00285 [Simkaniaceae bacterium]|nr:hypothetical protein [Simkaniaceae bacterium]
MDQKKTIIIYVDKGVSAFSVIQTKRMLKQFYPDFQILAKNHKKLLKKEVFDTCALLVVPGGLDVPYDRALRGEGNQNIVDFVNAGGNYLGICAGGYYGAASILFEKGYPLEVSEERELKFFPGKAVGTLVNQGLFSYDSEAGAAAVAVDFMGQQVHAYYNGGCYFDLAEKYPETVKILSHYSEYNKAAIVACKVGHGMAILSGIHFEYDPDHLLENQHSSQIKQRIQETNETRVGLIKSILGHFNING